MDPNRFDAIARALWTQRSRRGVLKALGAAALGAVGVAGVNRATEAAPGSPGGNSACDTFCHTVFGNTRAAGQCTSDAAHGKPDGICAQCNADPTAYCEGGCYTVNYATDPDNCGSCGNVCLPADGGAAVCSNGTCGLICDGRTSTCGPTAVGCCVSGTNCYTDGCCYTQLMPDSDICCSGTASGICTDGDDCYSGCCQGDLIGDRCCSPGSVGTCASGPFCTEGGCCDQTLFNGVCCGPDAVGLCQDGDYCDRGCCNGHLYGTTCCSPKATGLCTSGADCFDGCCFGADCVA